jgi:hypothetical protein
MKTLALFLYAFLSVMIHSNAQGNENEHLLDGTSMDYFYQNGTAVHVEFIDGQLKYRWIAGPNQGAEGQEEYRSRKIGDKMYLVNFMNESSSTFVTLIFNFNQNVMYSSALIAPGTEQEQILFDGGIIEHLILHEK